MKLFTADMSKASKEEVTAPVIASSPVPTLGFTVTVEVDVGGFKASPLFLMPTPVTLYSHPVLISIEFIVSVTVLSVSVWLVIEPCWKFGTTGTAFAAPALPNNTSIVISLFMTYLIVTSVTNCVVADVFAPPAATALNV